MKKIITILGARPQFIKASVLSEKLKGSSAINEVIVHTGQHYDENMSASFFKDLSIPSPKYNLEVKEKHHGSMTGKMMEKLEEIFKKEKPDGVLVYGDTNSTLAGALVGSKMHIPVFHIEAGLRSFNKKMPEEVNRVLTDHVSDLLFCPTETSVENLRKENITQGVHLVGDVMYESCLKARDIAEKKSDILSRLGLTNQYFSVVTLHRAENTNDPIKLKEILDYLKEKSEENLMIFPLHPGTRKKIDEYSLSVSKNIHTINPLGYFDMMKLVSHSNYVYTDSGGLQKEACFLQVPCITLRDETEWVETIESGWNRLWKDNKRNINKTIQRSKLDLGNLIQAIKNYDY